MKLLNGGQRRPFPAARRALCLILVAVATLGLPTPSQACGMVTHMSVARMASSGKYSRLYPDLATLLQTYPNAVASGSVFPDWGMSINVLQSGDIWETYAEVAHNHMGCALDAELSYREAYINYLESSLSPPYDEYDLKTIAFLFGMISHTVADNTFDTYFMPQAQQHWADSFGPADPRRWLGMPGHPEVDMGIDSFNHLALGLFLGEWTYGDWFFPADALAAAYDAVGCRDVTAGTLSWAMGEFKPRIQTTLDAEAATSMTYYSWRLKWALANYVTAAGGANDMYTATATAWQQKWDTWKPVTTIGLSPVSPDADDGWYYQPVTITLGATASLNGQIDTWYRLNDGEYQQYSGPFTIPREGTYVVSYYSVDSLKNAEGVQLLAIKGNVKEETVKIDLVDEPCPAGPELSTECDPQPPPYYVVVNGKQDCLSRTGSGCSPFILGHPECTDCATCNADVQSELCEPYLTGVVPEGQTEVVYEICQTGAGWRCRVRNLDSMGNCPIDDANPNWGTCQPPVTGINLPAPVIVGGLSILGAMFLAAGLVIRRRKD
jgi:hypothetical protein